ncbi:phosphatidylglycerophosphatase A [Thiorhodospira sibirica]|uniref:phosphatidylglycerophosphatase A family protein n=1 Tax=Thiorhodospira sibirica TaxID=154347 RepID=UPI00022C1704|nr:phosphatidylglycerophosphatase A [Thiorhodospira sibirica]
MNSMILFIAQGFGTGRVPKAPGTVGTLPGVFLFWLMADLPLWWYLGITLVLFALGVWICELAARQLGRDDPPSVVWDEIVGYLIAMIAAPSGWEWMVVGFMLFRLFDIWKPWPIRWIDRRVHGGMGIMLDDVLAGIAAAAVLHLLAWGLLHLDWLPVLG